MWRSEAFAEQLEVHCDNDRTKCDLQFCGPSEKFSGHDFFGKSYSSRKRRRRLFARNNTRRGRRDRRARTMGRTRKRCPHGREKHNCAECNPCPHGKVKYGCVGCNPCPHGKTKSFCAHCKPCPHERVKYNCLKCWSAPPALMAS